MVDDIESVVSSTFTHLVCDGVCVRDAMLFSNVDSCRCCHFCDECDQTATTPLAALSFSGILRQMTVANWREPRHNKEENNVRPTTMNKRKSQTMDGQVLVKKVKLSEANNVSTDLFEELLEDMFDDSMVLPAPNGSASSSQTMSTVNDNDSDDSMMELELDAIDAAVNHALKKKEDFLDLTTWRRCVVEECERDPKTRELVLRGREDAVCGVSMASPKAMVCRLQDAWCHCKIAEGDIVSVVAVWNVAKHCYCVSSREGFVVVRPDFLVSGTSVVGGLFCLRKSILSDRFKGIDANSKIVSESSVTNTLAEMTFIHDFTFLHRPDDSRFDYSRAAATGFETKIEDFG